MAALSYSQTPTPPAPATQATNSSSSSSNSSKGSNGMKENVNVGAVVTSLCSSGHSKGFGKITVHNVLSENSSNTLHIAGQNTIIRKIKDFGMLGAVNNAAASMTPTATPGATPTGSVLARKRPLGESRAHNEQNKASPATALLAKKSKLSTPKTPSVKATKKSQDKASAKAVKAAAKSVLALTSTASPAAAAAMVVKPAGTPGRKGLPPPQAVARRNARERNRVKQVNNGFAALRERIPEEVSEAFEPQATGRGSSKKLSKVETLRMAVEYIRSLERLLGFDFPPLGCHSSSSSSGEDSFMFIKDEFDGLDDHFDDSLSNYELDETNTTQFFDISTHMQQQQQHQQQQQQSETQPLLSPTPSHYDAQETQAALEQLLPSITTLNGLQYIRIPGTNTYQLLTPDMLGSPPSSSLDEEHFNALIDTNCLSSPPSAGAAAAAASAAATAAAIITTAALTAAPAAAGSNGECVKFAAALSRSPVPQAATAAATATTTATPTTSPLSHCSSTSLHQPPSAGAAAVSPVAAAANAAANELLLQTCAALRPLQQQQQQQQLHKLHLAASLIKQEYTEGDFVHVNSGNASSPNANKTLNFQQQQQQQHQQHQQQQHQLLCSPVLPAFYDNEPASFYDNVVVGLPSFKKEFNDVLLDSSTATTGTTAGGLSDESMIDAIDWWEAHTPKSDAGEAAAAVLM